MSDHTDRRRILAILASKLDPDDYETVVTWIADREQIIEDSVFAEHYGLALHRIAKVKQWAETPLDDSFIINNPALQDQVSVINVINQVKAYVLAMIEGTDLDDPGPGDWPDGAPR